MGILDKILTMVDEAHEKFLWNIVIIVIFTFVHWMVFRFYEEDNESFTISDAFYYTTITHFTVGYGDITPKTMMGRLITFVHIFMVWVVNLVPPQVLESTVESAGDMVSNFTPLNSNTSSRSSV